MAGIFDRFSRRYQKQQERKKRQAAVLSPDDAPLPEAPVEQARAADKPERNSPCPCGSGKKYKKCCGKQS